MKELYLKYKKILRDLMYTIGAQLLMNGVLQIIIYPIMNRTIGQYEFGNIITYMGFVYIIGDAIGSGICNNRLALKKSIETSQGDYNHLLKLFLPLSFIAGGILIHLYFQGIGVLIYSFIVLLTTIRYYGQVQFRLQLDFQKNFIYFAILTGGYGIGTIAFLFTKSWYCIFLIGEICAILYLIFTTYLFKGKDKSQNYNKVLHSTSLLIFSYLITDILVNLYRFVINYYCGPEAVSTYYVFSMIGKTLIMFTAPINNIILSYLADDKSQFNKSNFTTIVKIVLIVSVLCMIACVIVTPIYITLLYPNMNAMNWTLNIVVNAAQIFNFGAGLIITLILATLGAKYHLCLQLVYGTLFMITALLFTKYFGIMGFGFAACISNFFRLIEMLIVGYKKLPYSMD